ncbi:MAG: NACHT domain-containing protein [Polyangiaceae bacterium]|nr:NACHT domain-containing protein [Polyangiaceae bacterium]
MLLRGMAHQGVQALLQDHREAPFVGRDADRRQLAELPGGMLGVMCAPAGRGKSALLLRLALELDEAGALVAWVPISLRFGTHRSSTVEELLGARLRALLGGQGHPRERMTSHHGQPLWVMLDGLDELQDQGLLDGLAGLTLPGEVRLLVAARTRIDCDAAGWAAQLAIHPCMLFDLPPLSFEEVAAFPGLTPAPEVMRRIGGDPLLIRLCMECIRMGEALPDVRDPAELVGAWWSEQRERLQAPKGELASRILGALGAACGVVPWGVLTAVVASSEGEVRATLASFARFVIEVPEQGVTFAHPRFAEVARWTMPDEVQAAQRRFAELAREERAKADPMPYFLHFAAAHLEAAGAPDEEIHRLVSHASLEAWRRHEGSASGFVQDLRASWSRAERAMMTHWGGHGALAPLRQQSLCLAL